MPAHGRKLPSLVEQVESLSVRSPAVAQMNPPWPPNPFPRGMRDGKCTDRVLLELKRAYPQHLEHGQLRMSLGLSRGAVCWALRYLEARGLVARIHDPRNSQYRRWRAVIKDANV